MIISDCIFCKIASKEVPAEIVYEDETVVAFHDKHPVAPVHLLIIPKTHVSSVNQVEPADEIVIGHLVSVARLLATQFAVDQSGYRLVINSGPDAGQSVFHLHMHLIGGRRMPVHLE